MEKFYVLIENEKHQQQRIVGEKLLSTWKEFF